MQEGYQKLNIKRLALLILCVILWVLLTVWTGSNCLFKEIIGIPCPGCGSTRAFLALAHGDVQAALTWHPLLPLTIALILFSVCLITLKFIRRASSKTLGSFLDNPFNSSWFIWALVIIVAAYFAVYLVRMIMLFPDGAPLDYNPDSLLGRLVQKLR